MEHALRLRMDAGLGAARTAHVLGWTLARALSMAPDAAKHVAEPVSMQGLVDHALDRFCGVLGFPAVHGLGYLWFALVDHPERTLGIRRDEVLRRGTLALCTVAERRCPTLRLHIYERPTPSVFHQDQAMVASALRTIDLQAYRFRMGGENTEVVVFAERPIPDDDPRMGMLEAAVTLARVNAFPGPDRMRLEARRRVARRYGVELPEQRRAGRRRAS